MTEASPLREVAGANGSSGRAGPWDSILRPLSFPEVLSDVVIARLHDAHDDAGIRVRHRHETFPALVFLRP